MSETIALTIRDVDPLDNSRYVYTFPGGGVNFKGNQMAVSSISLYYSWFNISASENNNTFSYIWYSGAGPTATTINITVPDGFYTIADLNAYLQSIMITNGHYLITSGGDFVYYIEFIENPTFYAVQLNTYALPTSAQATTLAYTAPTGWPGFITTNITPRVIINSNNFTKTIGFTAGTYPPTTQANNYSKVSDFTPQVSPVQSITMTCSIIKNRLANPNTFLYSFSPINTSFGSTISPTISEFIWNPIEDGYYSGFQIEFKDQRFKSLPIRDPNLVIILSIK